MMDTGQFLKCCLVLSLFWFLVELVTYLYNNYREVSTWTCRHNEAFHKLMAWRATKPFLYYGTCPYAQSLILTMIDAYVHLMEIGYASDREYLERLKRMLHEYPPNFDPPASGSIL